MRQIHQLQDSLSKTSNLTIGQTENRFEHHDSFNGFLASLPFLAAFLGVLLSGFTSDALVRRGYSNEFARKTPILLGMLLSLSIIGANFTDSTPMVIFFLFLAFFGNGLASITWVFVYLLSPKRIIGLVGGVFNFIGGLAAAVTPVMIG